jgi:hypothetical protein
MSAVEPAAERQAVVEAFTAGGTVVIHAGAGTHKTSTPSPVGGLTGGEGPLRRLLRADA